MPSPQWIFTPYALLEGAADGLETSRGDIDGAVHPGHNGQTSLVIYDAVPGEAGSMTRIADSLDFVVETALKRMSNCDCGEETSCYGCLRDRRNERNHDALSRSEAVKFLELQARGGPSRLGVIRMRPRTEHIQAWQLPRTRENHTSLSIGQKTGCSGSHLRYPGRLN